MGCRDLLVDRRIPRASHVRRCRQPLIRVKTPTQINGEGFHVSESFESEMWHTDQSDRVWIGNPLRDPYLYEPLRKTWARTIMLPPSSIVSVVEARRVFFEMCRSWGFFSISQEVSFERMCPSRGNAPRRYKGYLDNAELFPDGMTLLSLRYFHRRRQSNCRCSG